MEALVWDHKMSDPLRDLEVMIKEANAHFLVMPWKIKSILEMRGLLEQAEQLCLDLGVHISFRGKPLDVMQAEVATVNMQNGWHDDERSFGEDVALLHSEVSEAFEAYRNNGLADVTEVLTDKPAKPEGVGSELADILIRLLDTCYRTGIDLEAEYERKIAYNKTRGYKHGGKLL